MYETPVGPNQLFVTYESEDKGWAATAAPFIQDIVAKDAARRDAEGWEIVSASVLAQRQMGTAGNMFFQSGGQYATQLAAVVLYRRR